MPRGHLPGGRRADHGPPGADPEDVDDRRHRAGHGEGCSTTPDVIRKKFRSAVTDSGREIRRGDDKPGVSNLIDILAVATQRTPGEIEVAYEGSGYGDLKRDVGEAVVELLTPVRERYLELRSDEGELLRLLSVGADKARAASAADARGDVRADGVREAGPLVIRTLAIAAAVFARRDRRRSPALHRRRPRGDLRRLRGRPRRGGVGDRDRDRVGGRAVRPRGHRRPPVDARQPPGALHRPLRALGRRARGRAVLDPRLAVRERAARARPRDLGGVDAATRRHDVASAPGCRTTPRRCSCSRCSSSRSSGSPTRSATARATTRSRSPSSGRSAC